MRSRPFIGEGMVGRPGRLTTVRSYSGSSALGVLVVGVLALSGCGGADESSRDATEKPSSKAETHQGNTAESSASASSEKVDRDGSTGQNLVSSDETGQITCVLDSGGGETITVGKAAIVTPEWWHEATDRHLSKKEVLGSSTPGDNYYDELKTTVGADARTDDIPDLLGKKLKVHPQNPDVPRALDDTDLNETAGCVSAAASSRNRPGPQRAQCTGTTGHHGMQGW